MAQLFSITDKAAATSTTAKTEIRLVAGANNPIWIVEWGLSFNDATTSDLPFLVEELMETTTSTPTGTTAVAVDYSNDGGTTAVTLTNALKCTAEGSPTLAVMDALYVPATTGYVRINPDNSRPKIAVSKGWRLRLTAPTAAPSVTAYVIWLE